MTLAAYQLHSFSIYTLDPPTWGHRIADDTYVTADGWRLVFYSTNTAIFRNGNQSVKYNVTHFRSHTNSDGSTTVTLELGNEVK